MDTTVTESSIYTSCTIILVGKCLCLYLWIKIIHVTFPYETQTLQLLCQNFAHTDNPTSYVGYGSYDWDQQYTIVLTWKLVCSTFSALHWCWTRNLFTLCIPRWTEMCWSLPCLQKGILLLCYLFHFKLAFYNNNIIVYFSGCLWFMCRI